MVSRLFLLSKIDSSFRAPSLFVVPFRVADLTRVFPPHNSSLSIDLSPFVDKPLTFTGVVNRPRQVVLFPFLFHAGYAHGVAPVLFFLVEEGHTFIGPFFRFPVRNLNFGIPTPVVPSGCGFHACHIGLFLIGSKIL